MRSVMVWKYLCTARVTTGKAARGNVASICSVQETTQNGTACSVADCDEKVWL